MKSIIIFLFLVNIAQAQFFQCPPGYEPCTIYTQPVYSQPVYSQPSMQVSTFTPAPMPKNLVKLPKKAPVDWNNPIIVEPKLPVIDYKKLAAEIIRQGGLQQGPTGPTGPTGPAGKNGKFNEKDLLLRIAKLEDQLKNIPSADVGESSRPFYMQIREQK